MRELVRKQRLAQRRSGLVEIRPDGDVLPKRESGGAKPVAFAPGVRVRVQAY
jgi:hypothetical protein